MRSVARATASSIDNFLDGYLHSAEMVTRLPHFQAMVRKMRQDGDSGPVLEYLRTLSSTSAQSALTDAFILDAAGNTLVGTRTENVYVPVPNHEVRPGVGNVGVYVKNGRDLYLCLATEIYDGIYLCIFIDIGVMSKSTSSFVMLGEKGYVMLKHSSGLIISHPVEEQVSLDVLEGRKQLFPNLDYSDLEKLIEEQKSGREGLLVYYSYWWADDAPKMVRKISAFISVPVRNDFIIVSAVNDYAELRQPILINSGFNIASAILITLGVSGMLLSRRRENQLQIQRENKYLRELNRSQEESQHNQRLRMIGTLTGGIAHEFRNLLTPIMGYSGMMRESMPPDSPYRDDVDEIYHSAVRAKEIIQQVTSLSRKNLDPALEPVSLDEVVKGVLKVAMTFKPSDVVIESQVNFANHMMKGNKTQLNQIFLNLINNAFQAMPSGGTLAIAGSSAKGEDGHGRLVLSFSDSGVGIDRENLESIFDPFFSTKRAGEGTGLGLSVVQNIVDAHNGKITVKSAPGQGATFTLAFPAIHDGLTRRASAVFRAHDDPMEKEQVSVVLVEDDPVVLRMLHRGLAGNGFTTQAFADAESALTEIVRNPCRLLVTDYDMPTMTGMELARRVHEKYPDVKVLVLTGLADAEIVHFMETGVISAYLIKPVPVSELVERINAIFA